MARVEEAWTPDASLDSAFIHVRSLADTIYHTKFLYYYMQRTAKMQVKSSVFSDISQIRIKSPKAEAKSAIEEGDVLEISSLRGSLKVHRKSDNDYSSYADLKDWEIETDLGSKTIYIKVGDLNKYAK